MKLVQIPVSLKGVALGAVASLLLYLASTRPTGCRSRVPAAKLNVRAVERALYQYWVEKDRCPTRADLLDQDRRHERDLVDPWGTVILYGCSRDDPEITSAGPDRLFGTADDIENDR